MKYTRSFAIVITSLLVSLIILLSSAFSETPSPRTLQSFGVRVQHGQPVYPLPSNVTLGLFNPDPLLDLAYYADASLADGQGKVQVWQNLGNGTFGDAPVWERTESEVVQKMEFKKTRMLTETIFDPDSWGDLVITFVDGRTEKISHEWMLNASRSFSSLPATTNSFPPLNFREVWRSERNLGGTSYLQLGDIDNDGRIELMYKFVDSTGNYGRLTVFENYGPGLYRVEWDSLMESGTPLAVTDIDNDGHKEIVVSYSIPGAAAIGLLECFSEGHFRFYASNIGVARTIFKVAETDIDHDGIKELTVLTSGPFAPPDPTLIYVAEFVSKGPRGGGGWMMAFNQELARYQGYIFDMAIGQVDGVGVDEIIPAGGSFGFYEPVPVQYLWRAGLPAPNEWLTRNIHTGLESGTGAVMFVNLDTDTAKEFVSGAPGPVGHGSMFALDYVSDTTWRVVWADSSLRSAPLWVNNGYLNGQFVLAGANVWTRGADTTYGELHTYRPDGNKVGFWHQDSVSIQQFHLLDIDSNGRTNLIFARISPWIGNYLMDVESDTTVAGVDLREPFPVQVELFQNYPNPFNPATTIRFSLSRRDRVALRVYDLLGQLVATLFDDEREAGQDFVTWDATNQPSGIYFYRLAAGRRTITKKMLLVR